MKSVFSTILIVVAIATLAAGSFAMLHMKDVDHSNCLAAIPGQPNCVNILNRVQLAVTHINALLSASLGIVNSFVLGLFVSLMLLAWVVLSDISGLHGVAKSFLRIFTEGIAESSYKQHRWISLHEKRAPSFVFAASG